MAELLLEYASKGCTVDCGANWTKEHIEAAIKRGSHIKSNQTAAAEYAWTEVLDRQKEGYCVIHKWDDIKNNHPP